MIYMKNKKYLFMLILFLLVIFLTYYSIYDKQSINLIINNLNKLSFVSVFICLIFILMYFIMQAIYMKTTLKSLKVNVSFTRCIFYCLVEFYFSGITPSSTGGQPVQLYYMTKDKIPIRKSYITLMLNTVYFKLIIFILGIISFFYTKATLFNNKIYLLFFILGIVVDLFIVIFLILLIFKQSIIKKIINLIIRILSKIKILNNKIKGFNVNEFLDRYKNELKYIKNNRIIVIINFFITLIQRLLLFSISFILYKSFGFNKYNYIDLIMIQISVQVAIEALPLPGGSGLSENMLKTLFTTLFGIKLCDIAMIFTRTFSFYIPLILSGIIILFNKLLKKNIRQN